MSSTDKQDDTPHYCSRARPCNRWRACSYCARRRQARIADAVERLAGKCGKLRWSILYPFARGEAGIKAIKADWLRHAAPHGAIWTIEQSKKTGALHCNIIAPAQNIHMPADAKTWDQIIVGDPRIVGAYIAKPQQMPKEQDFTGRLYGTAGSLWQWLAAPAAHPVVAAGAAQHVINREAMLQAAVVNHDRIESFIQEKSRTAGEINRAKWAAEDRAEKLANLKTPEEYRAIAARWLPDILSKCA